MRKKIIIQTAKIIAHSIFVCAEEAICHLVPSGQMLVDSDHLSFIYLMDDSEDYTYIVFPEQLWPALKTALDQKLTVVLTYHDEQIQLPNFLEELEYLLSNIKENSNYGEEMLIKIDHHF